MDLENPQFKNALNIIKFTNNSLFLTGKAGTGKSTFLKYIRDEIKKKSVVLAPTGIAAINVGGQTLHSFFKLPFHPLTPDNPDYATTNKLRAFLKYNKEQVKLIKSLELVIIDEISMVRADIIDFIDRIMRVYSGNMRIPFGGKQMLLVGDVFQLEPVVTRDERDIMISASSLSPILNEEEREHLRKYRSIDDAGRKIVDGTLDTVYRMRQDDTKPQ